MTDKGPTGAQAHENLRRQLEHAARWSEEYDRRMREIFPNALRIDDEYLILNEEELKECQRLMQEGKL